MARYGPLARSSPVVIHMTRSTTPERLQARATGVKCRPLDDL